MYIYTMKEYADVFKSENIGNDFCCNDELVGEFIDVLNLDQTQCKTNIIVDELLPHGKHSRTTGIGTTKGDLCCKIIFH
ncbi:unnamed protein product [Porites lobata]|uniref:Uncharacterized protein n=1 Tax=Porites lobata TaxID=104759 RepID=A0ABN8Q880_9CNID|nr:unnamed protein product [Porites lobata]